MSFSGVKFTINYLPNSKSEYVYLIHSFICIYVADPGGEYINILQTKATNSSVTVLNVVVCAILFVYNERKKCFI